MALKLNPGYVIAVFLNVALLCGIPFFQAGEAARLAPLIVLALAFPWLLAWLIGRFVNRIEKDARERRDRDDPADFV